MMQKPVSFLLIFFIGIFSLPAQKIVYSEPDREDQRGMNFDIIGKLKGNYLICKSSRSSYNITVFDAGMKVMDKVTLDFLPDRIINTEVLAYREHFYFFYEYQRKNIVYAMVAKMGPDGKIIGEPHRLDTTAISSFANNKIYTILNSEDRQRIVVLKINSKDPLNYIVTTSLFDADLKLMRKTVVPVSMQERSDFLTEFAVDNEGGIAFVRASGTSQNDNINQVTLITQDALSDSFHLYDLDISKIFLDDIRIKVDNYNKRYLLTSFYARVKRGNIDGLYCMLWDKKEARQIVSGDVIFSEDLRNDVKSEGGTKTAFNDFFLQNILMKKDGGFIIAAESVYTSSRGGGYNSRWDYQYGSPYWSSMDYYRWSSPYGYYPWWGWNSMSNPITRYFADNVAIMSFDSTVNMQWSSVLRKSQYDDNTDNFLGYGTLNTGAEAHFIFNQLERRTLLLTDQSITPDGKIQRSPTLKNLDGGYQFMPRYAKQVSGQELIVPCQYKNYLCFARIDYSIPTTVVE